LEASHFDPEQVLQLFCFVVKVTASFWMEPKSVRTCVFC